MRIVSLACAAPTMLIDNPIFLSLLDDLVSADGMAGGACAAVPRAAYQGCRAARMMPVDALRQQ